MELLENPLAKLPPYSYTIAVVVSDTDEGSGVDGDESDSIQNDRQKLEKIIHTDEDLKAAYRESQSSRSCSSAAFPLFVPPPHTAKQAIGHRKAAPPDSRVGQVRPARHRPGRRPSELLLQANSRVTLSRLQAYTRWRRRARDRMRGACV